LRCKNRLFSDTDKHFFSVFLKKKHYQLNYNEIDFYKKSKKTTFFRPAFKKSLYLHAYIV